MAAKKYIVELTPEERDQLKAMTSKGKSSAQSVLKARILLKADQGAQGEGWLDREICEALDTNAKMVERVRKALVTEGFEAVFQRKKRACPPITPVFDGEAEARLIALACSEPPEGYARWSIRLLTDKVVELNIVDHVHYNTVGRVLKKTNSNRIAANTG